MKIFMSVDSSKGLDGSITFFFAARWAGGLYPSTFSFIIIDRDGNPTDVGYDKRGVSTILKGSTTYSIEATAEFTYVIETFLFNKLRISHFPDDVRVMFQQDEDGKVVEGSRMYFNWSREILTLLTDRQDSTYVIGRNGGARFQSLDIAYRDSLYHEYIRSNKV